MSVRKNAKYLSPSEQADFVRACVMMKAHVVNPSAPASQQYDRWDEYVALHRMIQNAFAPSSSFVNFGHGGSGAYSFFSWHRYFLYRFELQLQSYVPGVTLPYWDWSDLSTLLTDSFLSPDGDFGTNIVSRGYFAQDAPGSGTNPTPEPAWWPTGLTGWNLSAAFPSNWSGPLTRNIGGTLPTLNDLRESLNKTNYSDFQDAIESGNGLTSFPFQQMHNGLHGYIGGHMGNPTASPFDPIFYLHHCNIDRMWAMWQMDGHANEYPLLGGNGEHHRNDIMYPWTGGPVGYGTYVNMAPIFMPDSSALGAQRNVDTLDHRTLGYSYDTLPIVGVSLDRTGSMTQLTPDPLTTSAPDATKWEATTRGASAFLQDCEAAYSSKEAYVHVGVETFRSLGGNQFTPVFSSASSGLIKAGGVRSRSAFDAAVASMTPSGGTPLADALTHADATLVKVPFSDLPAAERRYLAILTDGMRTTGATIASVPDGSLGDTVVFAMGFGTGADVDYATLDQLVQKGSVLAIPQVFHGENAGTIDKFFTNSLASAIGYTPVVDPLLELFAGEHTHVDFYATSAEDSFFITVQGFDFNDSNWSFHLKGPDGAIYYGHVVGHGQAGHGAPSVDAIHSNGRLSLFLRRDGAAHCSWVGRWQLMVAYKAPDMAKMLMLSTGALLAPASAGPLQGPRYYRPRTEAGHRRAARLVAEKNRHALGLMPPLTSGNKDDACNVLVNIYAKTRLQFGLSTKIGNVLNVALTPEALKGKISNIQAFGRAFSPNVDLSKLFQEGFSSAVTRGASLRKSKALKYDSSKILSKLEKEDPNRFRLLDQAIAFKVDGHGKAVGRTTISGVSGVHHIAVLVRGTYLPEHPMITSPCAHGPSMMKPMPERFERVLHYSIDQR